MLLRITFDNYVEGWQGVACILFGLFFVNTMAVALLAVVGMW